MMRLAVGGVNLMLSLYTRRFFRGLGRPSRFADVTVSTLAGDCKLEELRVLRDGVKVERKEVLRDLLMLQDSLLGTYDVVPEALDPMT